MKYAILKTVKRDEQKPTTYCNGRVRPQLEVAGNDVIDNGEYATGVLVDGFWHELPDNGERGEYWVLESVICNQFGYPVETADRAQSEFELHTPESAKQRIDGVGRGQLNLHSIIRIENGEASAEYKNEKLIDRKDA